MTKATTKKKLAVLGNGFLAGIIVEAYNKGLLEEYELTGILGRTKEKTEALAEKGLSLIHIYTVEKSKAIGTPVSSNKDRSS